MTLSSYGRFCAAVGRSEAPLKTTTRANAPSDARMQEGRIPSRRPFLELDAAPDAPGDFDDAAQLRFLIALGQRIPADGAREPALRADAELFERCVAGGLVDPAHVIVCGFEPGILARDDTEDDALFPSREQTERFETARPRGIILEEVAVDVDEVEQNLGDGIVAAFGHPIALAVSAALM